MKIRSEAITEFLSSYARSPLAKLYNPAMEVQVMVAQDEGRRYKGNFKGVTWHGWIDNDTGEIWKNFRIPLGANTPNPQGNDTKLNFDLASHVEGIGMTGWDWKNKVTRWVGYDFDSIVNHKAGLSSDDLSELLDKTLEVEGLSVYHSTSGSGYHIYLFFDNPIPAETHHEHSAIARALLSVLTTDTGFDFKANVDCVGSILWVWHRKSEGTNGLEVMNDNGKFPSSRLPKNWKDHVKVVKTKGKHKKTDLDNGLGKLATSQAELELDLNHRRVLKWLGQKAEFTFYWETDHQLVVAHTKDLLSCHKALGLKGLFETDSSGGSDQNCFMFPVKEGGWVVRRFGQHVQEHDAWITDEMGWTKIAYNITPTFESSCRFYGGLEEKSGSYVFKTFLDAHKSLSSIDLHSTLGDLPKMMWSSERSISINYQPKKNKIFISMARLPEDMDIIGWVRAKNAWEKVIRYSETSKESEMLNTDIDEFVRHTVNGEDSSGWYVLSNGTWVLQGAPVIGKVLKYLLPDAKANEIEMIQGKAVMNPWVFDNTPFEDEYPGGRIWNKQGAKLAYEPKKGLHPTWDMLLNHVGMALNEPTSLDLWCKEVGIRTGGEFLLYWVASVLQRPEMQLPYLFFCGEQKTGKSTFHIALEMLFEEGRGCAFADKALTLDFNAELYGAVLAVIEEIDLSSSKSAYNRLKDWVTADTIAIHTKFKNIFKAKSYLHFIQTANSPKSVPVFEGDTRVIVTQVFRLTQEIPKHEFHRRLKAEAPAFLNTTLSLDLPAPASRLGMPVLETAMKQSIIQSNYTPLDRFISEDCVEVAGLCTNLDDFALSLRKWLIANEYTRDLKRFEKHKLYTEFTERGMVKLGKLENGEEVIGNVIIKAMLPRDELNKLIGEHSDAVPLSLNERGYLC